MTCAVDLLDISLNLRIPPVPEFIKIKTFNGIFLLFDKTLSVTIDHQPHRGDVAGHADEQRRDCIPSSPLISRPLLAELTDKEEDQGNV